MYEQWNGVIMGGSLGPVLANITITEREKVIFDKLVEGDVIKFYISWW